MAVFTAVAESALRDWLAGYDVGELDHFEGIRSGVENTNYFVTTGAGRFVLTLFERLGAEQVPYYLALMHHLAGRGIACPDPIVDRHGARSSMLMNRPAALVTRLRGRAVLHPSITEIGQVGAHLAQMHLAAREFDRRQPNLRGLSWWVEAADALRASLPAEVAALLDDELSVQQRFAASRPYAELPRAAVHSDLFRDNVLFDAGRLSGVIDFYFAGDDCWLFDLAVTVNDWCIDDASGEFIAARLDALLSAYRAVRPPLPAECAAWPMMLRAAALRFWVSRLYDAHRPRQAQIITPKDPAAFQRILLLRRRHVDPLG